LFFLYIYSSAEIESWPLYEQGIPVEILPLLKLPTSAKTESLVVLNDEVLPVPVPEADPETHQVSELPPRVIEGALRICTGNL
jgi:hypothetical protein